MTKRFPLFMMNSYIFSIIRCLMARGERMRLEQLHYFETLIQEGSFTRAAEQLHISQPSLTASIKALEKELDKTLLVRDTRNFTITEEGKQVLAFAKETLTSYQNLLQTLNPHEEQIRGNMSIVAPKFFCELILEQLLHTLHHQYPQIKIHLMQNDFHTSPKQLSTTSCKFAILTQIGAKQENGLLSKDDSLNDSFYDNRYHYLPLFTDTLGICVAKTSPLAGFTAVDPDAIDHAQHPATLFPIGIMQFGDEVLLTSNNPQLHVDAIITENAYTALPYFVYQHYFAQEENITYRPFTTGMTTSWHLIYPKEHTLTAVEQLFIDELQQYLTQMKYK